MMRVNDVARFHEFRQATYTTGEHRRHQGKRKPRDIIAHVHEEDMGLSLILFL